MEAAEVYSGGSTVPAAVVIVVKHRAYLSVGQLIVGVQARLFVSLVGHGRLGRTWLRNIFQHWQFFLYAYGTVRRQQSVSLAVGGAASYQSAAGKAARVGLLQAKQRRSNGGQLQAEQQFSIILLQVKQ